VPSDLGIIGGHSSSVTLSILVETGKHVAGQDDQSLVVTIVTLYIAIGVIRLLFWELRSLVQVGPHSVAYLLIFAGAVCALPRMALRAAINARDGFVWTETVDLGRRIALLAVTVAMLLGLSFVSYSAISLLMWVLTIVALIWLAQRFGFARRR
jgi:hypothetical protein